MVFLKHFLDFGNAGKNLVNALMIYIFYELYDGSIRH